MSLGYFICEHGIDLSGAPCHICEAKPEWQTTQKEEKPRKRLKEAEKKRLEEAGFKIGDAGDFLNLTEEERKKVEERIKKHKTNGWDAVNDNVEWNQLPYGQAFRVLANGRVYINGSTPPGYVIDVLTGASKWVCSVLDMRVPLYDQIELCKIEVV